MPITANQSPTEWLSDILAALGGTAGNSSPAIQRVQGGVASGSPTSGANPIVIAGNNGSGNVAIPTVTTPADAASLAGTMRVHSYGAVYNGTTQDFARTANSAANTTGTGLTGVHNLHFDGTNYQKAQFASGVHANAWNAAVTGANGTSTALDCQIGSQVSFFGNTSGATTFTVQFSQDNTNWYDTGTTNSPGGAGNFGFTFVAGARYVRIKSLNSVTVTGTLAAKH